MNNLYLNRNRSGFLTNNSNGELSIPYIKIIKSSQSGDDEPSIDVSKLKFGVRLGDMATVVGDYTDGNGQKYKFAVLDSKYMNRGYWASSLYGTDTGLPNYTLYDNETAKESATYNTDYILNNYSGDLEAFTIARNAGSIELNGKSYQSQLPNAYELEQIWNMRNEIKALDPTDSPYIVVYDIAAWKFNNNSIAWTSNECNSESARYMNAYGSCPSSPKNNRGGILPIFEIPYGSSEDEPDEPVSDTIDTTIIVDEKALVTIEEVK